jgi:hypothetical protein
MKSGWTTAGKRCHEGTSGKSKVVDTHSVYLESPHIGDLEVLQLFYPHWRGEAHAKDGPDDAKAAEEQ